MIGSDHHEEAEGHEAGRKNEPDPSSLSVTSLFSGHVFIPCIPVRQDWRTQLVPWFNFFSILCVLGAAMSRWGFRGELDPGKLSAAYAETPTKKKRIRNNSRRGEQGRGENHERQTIAGGLLVSA